jgi:hypothetical protein
MNEKIEGLWWKARIGYNNQSCDPEVVAKFAQLIVQECISINRQRMFSDYEGDTHRVAHNNALLCANSDIFENFGVGE